MKIKRFIAISNRILLQIIGDKRTIGLIVVAPLIVMSLAGFSFINSKDVLNRIAPGLICTFAFFFTFLLTAVSFYRERVSGTLERLFTTPATKTDVLLGYLFGFLPLALIQATLIVMYSIFVLRVDYEGNIFNIMLIIFLIASISVNLGIFLSTFARNEFQIMQFIPVIFAPQIFLAGLIMPIDDLPIYFEILSFAMPLRYAIESLQAVMIEGESIAGISYSIGILIGFNLFILGLSILSIKNNKQI